MEVSALEELKKVKITASNTPVVNKCKSRKSTSDGGGYGTGKRKNSIARVWVKPGQGKITVNNKSLAEYFPRKSYRNSIIKPFIHTNTIDKYDIICTAKGGGTTGQAGAIIHGIARALDCISDEFHSILRKNGFLTRDSRVVERKKIR